MLVTVFFSFFLPLMCFFGGCLLFQGLPLIFLFYAFRMFNGLPLPLIHLFD